jgi:molecular chaperone IbpA
MRNYDLSPLWRSTVGFDRLIDLIDDSVRWEGEDNYLSALRHRAHW